MPEGHSVHRITRQFRRNFVGTRVAVSSPQGRFAVGAAEIDGATMIGAMAVGKQMFLEFDNGLWLRVHLGMYGAWDFSGEISVDATIAAANGRMGQTNQRGTVLPEAIEDRAGENSLASIGAPRRARLRMAESKRAGELAEWPPEPVGQVRVRLLNERTCADLRGPTACEVQSAAEVQAVIARLGPDPALDAGEEARDRFVAAVSRTPTPIGRLLMDQSVVAGIGNVYRAELLFRARLNPHAPGRTVTTDQLRALWEDWAYLLAIGIDTGQMMTMDDLGPEEFRRAMASRDDRHWVYHRAGLPCRICGTSIVVEDMAARKLYYCPSCQA